jgi:hypothetical protein
VRLKGKRAVVVQSATETLTPRAAGVDAGEQAGRSRPAATSPTPATENAVVAAAEKVASMALAMGIKRARLYLSVATPYVEMAHKPYKVPPMSARVATRYLQTKLQSDFAAQPDDLIWDRPLVRNGTTAGAKSIVTLAARRSEMAPFLDLEDHGLTVELITSPEMAVWALARRAGLLDHRDALLIYPTAEKVHLVAAGPGGPFLTRSVDVGAGLEGFVLMRTVLPAEVRHALIYLQQHQQRTLSRMVVLGRDIPDDAIQELSRAAGLEGAGFTGDDLISSTAPSRRAAAAWPLVAASLPWVGAGPPSVNLAKTSASMRHNAKTVGAMGWIAGLVLLAGIFKWGLDLDIAEQRAQVRVAELDRSVAELKTLPPPVVDWRVTEVNAVKKLAEDAEFETPPWAEVLHELGHITPASVRFESLAISKGGTALLPTKPGSRRAKGRPPAGARARRADATAGTVAGGDPSSKPWVLEVAGTVSGQRFAELQEGFRAWYEDAVVSPYLARMDIGGAEIKKAPSRAAASSATSRRRGGVMATGLEVKEEPESVLSFHVKANLLTSEAVRQLVSELELKENESE